MNVGDASHLLDVPDLERLIGRGEKLILGMDGGHAVYRVRMGVLYFELAGPMLGIMAIDYRRLLKELLLFDEMF